MTFTKKYYRSSGKWHVCKTDENKVVAVLDSEDTADQFIRNMEEVEKCPWLEKFDIGHYFPRIIIIDKSIVNSYGHLTFTFIIDNQKYLAHLISRDECNIARYVVSSTSTKIIDSLTSCEISIASALRKSGFVYILDVTEDVSPDTILVVRELCGNYNDIPEELLPDEDVMLCACKSNSEEGSMTRYEKNISSLPGISGKWEVRDVDSGRDDLIGIFDTEGLADEFIALTEYIADERVMFPWLEKFEVVEDNKKHEFNDHVSIFHSEDLIFTLSIDGCQYLVVRISDDGYSKKYIASEVSEATIEDLRACKISIASALQSGNVNKPVFILDNRNSATRVWSGVYSDIPDRFLPPSDAMFIAGKNINKPAPNAENKVLQVAPGAIVIVNGTITGVVVSRKTDCSWIVKFLSVYSNHDTGKYIGGCGEFKESELDVVGYLQSTAPKTPESRTQEVERIKANLVKRAHFTPEPEANKSCSSERCDSCSCNECNCTCESECCECGEAPNEAPNPKGIDLLKQDIKNSNNVPEGIIYIPDGIVDEEQGFVVVLEQKVITGYCTRDTAIKIAQNNRLSNRVYNRVVDRRGNVHYVASMSVLDDDKQIDVKNEYDAALYETAVAFKRYLDTECDNYVRKIWKETFWGPFTRWFR